MDLNIFCLVTLVLFSGTIIFSTIIRTIFFIRRKFMNSVDRRYFDYIIWRDDGYGSLPFVLFLVMIILIIIIKILILLKI